VLDRRKPTDEATQNRLLEISGDVVAIGELANDVIAPHHTSDGSPMLTSQAAAVIAAYHHLVGIVDVLSPERRSEVMQNLAAATGQLKFTGLALYYLLYYELGVKSEETSPKENEDDPETTHKKSYQTRDEKTAKCVILEEWTWPKEGAGGE